MTLAYEPSLMANLITDIASGKVVPLRQKVLAFEEQARKVPSAKYLTKLFHHFGPKVYMRELHIPAGIISTGKIHKYECLNILTKGRRMTVVDGRIQDIKAPHIHLSPAGSKRISYTLEDAIWITVHENQDNCTDTEELERRLACDSEEEYQAFLASRERQKCLS